VHCFFACPIIRQASGSRGICPDRQFSPGGRSRRSTGERREKKREKVGRGEHVISSQCPDKQASKVAFVGAGLQFYLYVENNGGEKKKEGGAARAGPADCQTEQGNQPIRWLSVPIMTWSPCRADREGERGIRSGFPSSGCCWEDHEGVANMDHVSGKKKNKESLFDIAPQRPWNIRVGPPYPRESGKRKKENLLVMAFH